MPPTSDNTGQQDRISNSAACRFDFAGRDTGPSEPCILAAGHEREGVNHKREDGAESSLGVTPSTSAATGEPLTDLCIEFVSGKISARQFGLRFNGAAMVQDRRDAERSEALRQRIDEIRRRFKAL